MGGTGGGFKPGSCQILRFSGRGSGVFEVFGGIELEVHGEMGRSVGFYPFFDKLEVVGVVEDDGEFIEGFDFDGEEEGPLGFWVDVAAGADVGTSEILRRRLRELRTRSSRMVGPTSGLSWKKTT